MALSRSFFLLAFAICCSQVWAQYQPTCQSTVMYIMNSDCDFSNYGNYLISTMATTSNFSFIDVSNGEDIHYSLDYTGVGCPTFNVDNLNWIHQDIPKRYFDSNTRIVLFVSIYMYYLTNSDSAGAIIAAANRLKEQDNVEIFLFGPYWYENNFNVQTLQIAADVASNPTQDHVLHGEGNSNDKWQKQFVSSVVGAKSLSFATIGDPYVHTMDGNTYSFNGLGEFTLYRSYDYEIQVRMAPCDNSNPASRTCNRAVAIYSFDYQTAVELHYDPVTEYVSLYADGGIVDYVGNNYLYSNGWSYSYGDINVQVEKYDTPIDVDAIYLATFQLTYYNTYVQVAFGSKVGLAVSGSVSPYNFGNVHGLVGNWDGCSDNDYYSRNQTYTSPSAAARDIYFNFADTWRVNQQESFFSHGINAQYYMPHYDEYAPQWNPAFTGVDPSANAAGDCAYFKDISPFLYTACVDDVSKGNGDIRPIAYMMANLACSDYCAYGVVTYDYVSESYCASTCPTYNDLDFHEIYNSTAQDFFTLTQTAVGATFSATLGGTYTYALTSGYCPEASVTGTVQITCDQPPQVSAGDDRVVMKHPVYSWPWVVLMGSVSDQNNDALEYSWEIISVPQPGNYTPGSWTPYVSGDFPELLGANSLTPFFEANYPGDYVLELAVFDGCFIAKDQVVVHAQCGQNCKLEIEAEQLDDIVYKSYGVNNNQFSTSYGYSTLFDYEFADNVDYHWFIDSNSRGYNFTYPEPSNTDYYEFTKTTPEITLYTNVTVSTSTIPDVESSIDSVNTANIIRNEAKRHSTTTTTTTSVTTSTETTYSSIVQDLTQCIIQIAGASYSSEVSFYVYGDLNATYTRPFTQSPACIGDYTVRVATRDECQSDYDLINLHIACSAQPQAHLISCTKTIKFDYSEGAFPSVNLDGSDTFDIDTYYGYLLYQWQYNTPSGVTKYMTPACTQEASTNAYVNCPKPSFQPDGSDGPGVYNVTMWVSDGCTYDYESTTIVAQCDPLTVSASAVNVNQDQVSPANGASNLTGSFASDHEAYVTNQWTLTSAPAGYLLMPNLPPSVMTATNATANVFLGGTYTYTYSAFDGCTTATQAVSFTYTCSDSLNADVTASQTALTYDTSVHSYGTATTTLLINTTINTNSGRAYYQSQLVGKPVDSALGTTPSGWLSFFGGSNPTFDVTPDVVGTYTVQFWATDSCRFFTKNVTITATCAASGVPSISGLQSTYTLPAFQGLSVNGINISSAFENYTISWILTGASSFSNAFAGPTYGLTSVNVPIPAQAGNYHLMVTADTGAGPTGSCLAVATANFAATCNVTLGITAPTGSYTSAFTRGKFSRVTMTPSFTGVDSFFDPMRTYLSNFVWKFTSAPVNSVFAPYTSNTTVTINGTTNDSGFVANGNLWTRTWTRTDQVINTQTTQYVTLESYDDSYDSYDGCFAPDVAGTYVVEFSIVDYCGQTVKQTYTVNAGCNAAPSASAGSATTYTFDGTGFASSYGYRVTTIPLNGTASDTNGDFLDYQWEIVSQPNDTTAYLTNQNSRLASLAPTAAGVYVLQFSATDGCTTTSSNVTITVKCPNNYKVNDPISFTFDGFTPVALQEFSLLANPQCTRSLTWEVTKYDPSTAIPPPSATTTESPKSGASLIAIPAFLIACLALFINML